MHLDGLATETLAHNTQVTTQNPSSQSGCIARREETWDSLKEHQFTSLRDTTKPV